MKAPESTRFATYNDFLDFIALAENRAKAQTIPALYRFIQQFEAELNSVPIAESQAKQPTKGATKEKNKVKLAAKTATLSLAKPLLAHALEQKNLTLEETLKALIAKVLRAVESELAMACREIIEEAKKLQEHWADFGITATKVTDIEAKIALFGAQAPKKNALKGEKKKGVKNRATHFANISALKEQIINTAAAFIETDNVFYDELVAALKLPTVIKTQIKVVFKTAETKEPIINQSAHIFETKDVATSNKKGEVSFKFAKSGTYTIHVTLPDGSVKIIENVKVVRGKTTKLVVFI